ncbi:hypothetical protein A9Q99_21315 [Gammaproteobacteria bacterium 45_16_T64]|nr:hypothetical protein A9Q99_21315 [Gammaproteobacteria bacterium 45_16_T64]
MHSTSDEKNNTSMSRRKFLGGTLATAAAGTVLPGCKVVAGSGSNTIPEPPQFPENIELYQRTFTNWAREVKISGVWFCSPMTADEVLQVANWAKDHDYRLRPMGSGHGFAPTLLPRGHSGEKVILINTHDYMNSITVNTGTATSVVHCDAGAYIEDICAELELFELGLYHTTAPGGVSIAGALAMNAHGAAIPKDGETLARGHSWGTLSNLVLELTAVAWDESLGQYTLKTYVRNDPEIGPLLTCLARAFITSVTLQAGPNLKIRLKSQTDLTASEVLALPENETENSFSNLSYQYGTVDIIYYPFNPENIVWLKYWTVTPEKPATSREVFEPYQLTDGVTMAPWQADILSSALRTFPRIVPQFNKTAVDGLLSLVTNEDPNTKINDLWGSAYTTTLYVQPDTPRVTVAAWGVVVSRHNMQRALAEWYVFFTELLNEFQSRGLFPYSGPVELRAHGLDNSDDVLTDGAIEPTLSGARPHPDHPDKDTIIWFAINNNVDQPAATEFNTRLEQWFYSNYASYGLVRPEWTKGYAYTADGEFGGAWTNNEMLTETYPQTWGNGYPADNNWSSATAQFWAMDPHGIFSNKHLDKLFPPND